MMQPCLIYLHAVSLAAKEVGPPATAQHLITCAAAPPETWAGERRKAPSFLESISLFSRLASLICTVPLPLPQVCSNREGGEGTARRPLRTAIPPAPPLGTAPRQTPQATDAAACAPPGTPHRGSGRTVCCTLPPGTPRTKRDDTTLSNLPTCHLFGLGSDSERRGGDRTAAAAPLLITRALPSKGQASSCPASWASPPPAPPPPPPVSSLPPPPPGPPSATRQSSSASTSRPAPGTARTALAEATPVRTEERRNFKERKERAAAARGPAILHPPPKPKR